VVANTSLKSRGPVWPLFIVLWLVQSCASYTQTTQKMRDAYRGGDYYMALEMLDKSLRSSKNDRLLYLLERGVILDRLGERTQSRQSLFDADALADKLYTTSISKEALTYIYNESAQSYPGEDYEILGLHAFLALSFLEEGDIKAARIQANKINNKIAELNNRYDKNKNRLNDDAFGRYLAGTIYESLGQIDDAIIDYRKALQLYEGIYQKDLATQVPEQLVIALYNQMKKRGRDTKDLETNYKSLITGHKAPAKSFQVVVFHEVGTNVEKQAQEILLPVGDQIHRVSFPVLHLNRDYPVPRVHISDTVRVSAEQIQPFDRLSKMMLEDRQARYMIKAAARIVLKAQMQIQAKQQLGELAGLAASVYNIVTETADTRSWTTMPGRIFVTRLYLAEGEHNLSIRTGSQVEQKNIRAKAGEVIMLRHKG
jgi:uncharacterized protein